jgi:hypothetical protein
MELKKLKELRRRAEQATSDMPDGELKLKAFEVILSNLLRGTEDETGKNPNSPATVAPQKRQPASRAGAATSAPERILVLKAENYFAKLRTIGEVREQLASRGWNYPSTALSGPLQQLVRHELRRQRVSDGGKKVWKYSNR